MPNWCCTSVRFKGSKESIKRLADDFQKSMIWGDENPLYCNLHHFFSLSGLDVKTYLNRYTKRIYLGKLRDENWWYPIRINFRGSVVHSNISEDDNGTYLDASLEMAWNTDYEILHLISKIYNVEFGAYSEELGMWFFTKCRNGDINDYNFDHVIAPNYEQVEEAADYDSSYWDLSYPTPVMANSSKEQHILNKLNEADIEYTKEEVEEIDSKKLIVYGVYYDPIKGVIYDNQNE